MAGRRAIGATLASTVIFATLLLASFELQYSAEGLALNSYAAEEENRLASNAALLRGVAETELLAKAASLIASRVYNCSDAPSMVYSSLTGLEGSARGGNVTLSLEIVPRGSTAEAGDPMVKPYDQAGPGLLVLSIRSSVAGSSQGGSVNYSQSGDAFVSLPFDPTAPAKACEDFLESMRADLGPVVKGECNDSMVAAVVNETVARFRDALPGGYVLSASFRMLESSPCSADVSARVEEYGIEGPGGGFTFAVQSGVVVPG